MKQKELDSLLKKWQEILSLQDWTIKVRLVDIIGEDDDCLGICDSRLENKTAVIIIKNEIKPAKGKLVVSDYEHCLVHELLHLIFAWFDSQEKVKHLLVEQYVAILANGLISLDRKWK